MAECKSCIHAKQVTKNGYFCRVMKFTYPDMGHIECSRYKLNKNLKENSSKEFNDELELR